MITSRIQVNKRYSSCRLNRNFLSLALLALLTALTAEAARAATINVPAGGDFQGALDSAQPGDTITLAAGATYTGPFTLLDKPGGGTAWITIRTFAPDSSLPPAGQRITPDYAPALPKIVSPGFNEPALRTAPGAHHYRFVGVEFAPVSASAVIDTLVLLGDTGPNQDTPDEVPHHLSFDRCYVHAFPTQNLKRGIALQSAHTDILNSHVAGFKVVGQEAQAIAGWNGPGPFRIINNYIEGAGENLMFGGAVATLPNLIPSDIEVRRNHFYKPPSWREGDPHWTVKNLFELKNAQRVVIEGNVFENNWVDAQNGFSILFTPRPSDSGPAAVVQDVQFINNVVRNVAQGVNFLGIDNVYCAPERPDCGGPRLHRVTVSNNLFLHVGAFGGAGRWLQVLSGTNAVTVDHNTAIHTGHGLMGEGVPNTGFAFKNNLMRRNYPEAVGVFGDGKGEGFPSLDWYFPSAVFQKNLVYGVEQIVGSTCWHSLQFGCYPAGNFYPPDGTYGGTFEGLFASHAGGDYRLAAGSPYRSAATDGKDVGADIDALSFATAGAVSGTSPENLALGGLASQSTTALGGVAGRAVDDLIGGNWAGNSVTHTNHENQPWWQVDIGSVRSIQRIDVWNRTDCCGERLSNFYVFVSDVPFTSAGVAATLSQPGVSSYYVPGQAGVTASFTINRTARYVRVQLNGADSLSLAEVQVWGATTAARTNVALASNGGLATASSEYHSVNYPAAAVNNGDRKGLNWGAGGGWNDNTSNVYPDWVQVDFAGSKTIDEVDVFTLQDNFGSPAEPTEAMTFAQYGVTDFEVLYWDGAAGAWAPVTGGLVNGNNKVWRRLTFTPVTTTKIRVVVNAALFSSSRVVELEAWQVASPARVNHALASNGGAVTASTVHQSGNYPASSVNDGDRKGLNWGAGGGWNDDTANHYPDSVEIAFSGTKAISEVNVFTLQDNFANPSEPTEAMTFSQYGVTDFKVQYWDGSAWVNVAGGVVAGNNRVWRRLTFPPVNTTKVRVQVDGALFGHSRLVEVEVY